MLHRQSIGSVSSVQSRQSVIPRAASTTGVRTQSRCSSSTSSTALRQAQCSSGNASSFLNSMAMKLGFEMDAARMSRGRSSGPNSSKR